MNDAMIFCQNLGHRYQGKTALKAVNLALAAGEPIALVGPNGAGKSTFLNILAGFLRPDSGTVSLFGHTPGSAALVGKVAALPQDARLDPNFSIQKQLVFYARLQGFSLAAAQKEVERVLAQVALSEVAKELPGALSHGMAKRVAIAQAFIGKPLLILLDEPTAGLDPVNVRAIRTLITDHKTEITFIISSHDLTELDRLCQRLLMMEQGVLRAEQLNTAQVTRRFITLLMNPASPSSAVLAALQAIAGVVQVSQSQQDEFIIEYPAELTTIDQQILQCLSRQQWSYRQLSHGKSLEEKLFFS